MTQPNWGANANGPGSSEYCNPGDLLGRLAIVWVIQEIPDAGPTANSVPGKPNNAIQVDVVKLNPDDPSASTVHRTQDWRGWYTIRPFRPLIGDPNPTLITVSERTPGNMTTRYIEFVGADPNVQALAQAWYESLGPEGFTPSPARPYTPRQPQQQSQYQGWPQDAQPRGGYHQQQGYQGGYPPQGQYQQPQQPPQQQWGAPQQQGYQPAPAQQQAPRQWGAPQQVAPAQQWGGGQQQAPQGYQQAPAQQPRQWGAPQQVAPQQQAPRQWGAPQQQAPQGYQQPVSGPPAGNSVLDMITGSGGGGYDPQAQQQYQGEPPF